MDLSLSKTVHALQLAMPALVAATAENRERLYQASLQQIRSFLIDVRPGRRFARDRDTKPKNKGNGVWRKPRSVPQS